jgi:hypothetical protein
MWTFLAATALLMVGAANPRWYSVLVSRRSFAIGLKNGSFECSCGDLIPGPGWDWRTGWNGSYQPEPWWWHRRYAAGGWSVGFHLWLPAGATFVVSALSAFNAYRTRRRPGHCPCGYDRSGLPTDAPCPECGR